MKHKYKLLVIYTVVLSMGQHLHAQHIYYLQNRIITPSASGPRDIRLDAGYILNDFSNGIQIQSSLCTTHHLCFSLNAMKAWMTREHNYFGQSSNYRFGEAGMGLYERFGPNTINAMGGYGRGQVENIYLSDMRSELKLERIFLQTGLCYSNKHFEGRISLRMSRVKYLSGSASVDIPEPDLSAIQTIEKKSPFYLPELGMEAGWQFWKMYAGFGSTALLRNTSGAVPWIRVSFAVVAGIKLGKGG